MSDRDRVAAIRGRLGKATPAPWSQGMIGDRLINEVDYSAAFGFVTIDPERGDDGAGGVNDADLIANAPNDLTCLCDRVEELEAALADWESMPTYAMGYIDAEESFRPIWERMVGLTAGGYPLQLAEMRTTAERELQRLNARRQADPDV